MQDAMASREKGRELTLTQKLQKQADLAFLRSLYQRAIDGETLVAGEHYIYLNGMNVEERKATAADVSKVLAAL